MKTLFLLRHAKSSWDDPTLADFERPLNGRGLKAAPFMGEFLRKNGFFPQMIVSSPAVRARHTAELVNDAGGFNAELKFEDRIYEASPHALREVVAGLSDRVDNLMVVGHNPGIEALVRSLTGRIEPMPTAAAAIIDLSVTSWSELVAGSGTLRHIFRPKELAAK